MEERVLESCVRGHHIYKDIWSPVIGERLVCERERHNTHDRYAVAVKRESTTVGHLPKKYSCTFSLLLRGGGSIDCTVTGTRRYSTDLSQGGLEVPCEVTLKGTKRLMKKVNRHLNKLQ